MANRKHLEILKRGVEEWNRWRYDNPDIKPDLSGAKLHKADLRKAALSWVNLTKASITGANLGGADLGGANLSEAKLNKAKLNEANLVIVNLSGADLSGAELMGAELYCADLSGAVLTRAILRDADLSEANLSGTKLSGANLIEANLTMAILTGAVLNGANLIEANLLEADLSGADLTGVDLSRVKLTEATLRNASLQASRLLNANLDGAILTGACLWETQRTGWSIKGVICESVFWGEGGKKLESFKPGDFERLHSEKARVQIKYADGIRMLEIATLPALIQHLEASHPETKLRIESIQDASGGAVVSLVLEDISDISAERVEELRTAIQLEAEQTTQHLRLAIEEREKKIFGLESQVEMLKWSFNQVVLNQKPNIYLSEGDLNMSSDTYNISGQAGAVGPNAHAHDMTFNQIGSRIENSMELTALAQELEVLRQALKKEATTEEHDSVVADVGKAKKAAEAKDSTKLAESLKSAGKWALDVATKIGVSLATEAIKQSTGMK